MRALHFLVDVLFTLYAVVLLLRLLMQATRADFRNPLGRAVIQLSDPVVMPLRRVFAPVRRIDTASVVALVLCVAAKVWLLMVLAGIASPPALLLLRGTAIELVDLVLRFYFFAILLNALLSFVAPGNYSPAQSLLSSLVDPVLDPIRRVMPPIAGLDLSPLWACIAIQMVLLLVH